MRRAVPALVLSVVALVAGCGDDAVESTRPGSASSGAATATRPAAPSVSAAPAEDVRVVTVSVAGGEVTRESRRVDVRKGDKVRIEVTADVRDEVHLHGYDVHVDVVPGTPATLEFTATIAGQFTVELEESKLLLVVIAVR